MKVKYLLLFLTGIAALSLHVSHASAECYMDTPSGYGSIGGGGRIGPYPSSSDCEAVNSQYFGGRGSCSCSSDRSYGGTSGGSSSYNWKRLEQERLLQEDLLRRQREEAERQRKRNELRQAEEESRKREELRQQSFDNDKRDAVESMKGGASDPALKTVIPFGIKSSPGASLGLKGDDEVINTRSITAEWKQAYCGMWIAGHTVPAAKNGDVEEVRYLGRQALKSFSGGLPELQCPETPPPPDLIGKEISGKNSPVVKFHDAMLQATEKQAERISRADKQILEASLKKKNVEEEIRKIEETAEEIEKEIKQAGPIVKETEAPEQEKKDVPQEADEAMEKKKRALAEALAALKKAKQVAADIDTQISKAQDEKKAADTELDAYGKLSKEVRDKPGSAPELTTKINK